MSPLDFLLLAFFIIVLLYLLFRPNPTLSPSWRPTSNGFCEVCNERKAILVNKKSGLEVCEFCDNLLP